MKNTKKDYLTILWTYGKIDQSSDKIYCRVDIYGGIVLSSEVNEKILNALNKTLTYDRRAYVAFNEEEFVNFLRELGQPNKSLETLGYNVVICPDCKSEILITPKTDLKGITCSRCLYVGEIIDYTSLTDEA